MNVGANLTALALFGALGLAAAASGVATIMLAGPLVNRHWRNVAKKLAVKHGAIDIIQQWYRDLLPSVLVTDRDFILLTTDSLIRLKCPRGNILGASIYKERPGTKKNIVLVDYIHPKRKKKKSIKLDFYGENSYKQAEFGIAKFEEYMLKEQ